MEVGPRGEWAGSIINDYCVHAGINRLIKQVREQSTKIKIATVESFFSASGCKVLSDPFQCCLLTDFVHEEGQNGHNGFSFVKNLKSELFKLKYHEKNNDLYQFRQVRTIVTSLCKINFSFFAVEFR